MNDEFAVALTQKYCMMFHFMIFCAIEHKYIWASYDIAYFRHWFIVFLIFVKIFNSTKFFFSLIDVLLSGNVFCINELYSRFSDVSFFIWYVNFSCVSFWLIKAHIISQFLLVIKQLCLLLVSCTIHNIPNLWMFWYVLCIFPFIMVW